MVTYKMQKRMRIFLPLLVVLFALALIASLFFTSAAAANGPRVYVLNAKGAVTPPLASYIMRGIDFAESKGASLIVIQLATPGGLDSSMRDIIQRILISRVPIAVYVYPPGARAASAGAFITMSAHIAAMAPNTTIGAASPVSIGGSGEAQELPETMKAKVMEDAAAYMRGLATQRQRNVQLAESMVREARDFHHDEALKEHIVDYQATDLDSLLAQLDGKEVSLLTEKVIIQTKGATVTIVNMNPFQSFLFAISNPNIAYILLSLAMIGLLLELSNPGAILPGVIGGISLLLALYSLGTLEVYWAGVLLIALAFILFIADIFVTSHGILTVGGLASFIFGSLILFRGGPAGALSVDWRLIAVVAVGFAAFFVFVLRAIVQAHRRRATTGIEGLVGKIAVARTPLNPGGTVFVEGERWSARLEEGEVAEGDEVIVTRVEGLKLWVRKK
ncbi:MAG: nodulation protein NfeD [Chloroflexi bacterium]|nr:nodulation protein NfeD [Chloroflexota bacterium]